MHICILTYLESERARKTDIVVDHVSAALKELGHDVRVLAVHGDINRLLDGLMNPRPDLVFNLMEMFGKDFFSDVEVAGLLDLIDMPHTGGGPGEVYLQQDKALAKKILAFEGVLYPRFAVFSKDQDLETGGNLRMPLFVKPLRLDASLGIDSKSLVTDSNQLMKQVLFIHEKVNDSALAEEFIDGREFYVGILGNQDPRAFPPIELDFSKLPEGSPRIADRNAKFEKDTPEYKGTKAILAQIPDETRAKLQKTALQAYRALRVRDYGRVDLRLTDTGDVYVIEVNASCYLEKESEFAMAAKADGLEYNDLIRRIMEEAQSRWAKVLQAPRRKRAKPGNGEPRKASAEAGTK
jgi:D-alanine-D-alanine ligase